MRRENIFIVLRLKVMKLILKILNYGIIVSFMEKILLSESEHIL